MSCQYIPGLSTDLSINYNYPSSTISGNQPLTNYQYQRYCPNYLRYPDTFSSHYFLLLLQNDALGDCLRLQLTSGQIQVYSVNEVFVKLVPTKEDDKLTTTFKDNKRNELIKFCLDIEKTTIFYNQSRTTCAFKFSKEWDATYNIILDKADPLIIQRVIDARSQPLSSLNQVTLYNLSVSYSNYFFNRDLKFNWLIIWKLVNGDPVDPSLLPPLNFYELIFLTYVLLSQLFSISHKLLLGLCPGVPQEIVDLFFTTERQLYYFNLYLDVIATRNRLLGFGDKINASNGDGTYVAVPNLNTVPYNTTEYSPN